MVYHNPVLLHPSIEGLNINPNGVYVDATFGGGGHAHEILSRLKQGRLVAFDQDEDAKSNIPEDNRLLFIPQNFRFMRNFLMLHGLDQVDGILADLGVSSYQFDKAEKGFSTRFTGPLDMRMDKNNPIDARQVVNEYDQAELKHIFQVYGELDRAGQMAAAICQFRTSKAMESTADLKQAVVRLLPKGKENKVMAQLFQAIRMEVNQEIGALKQFLEQCTLCLNHGGRLVVIAYHSLEDRLIKNFMRAGNFEGAIEKDFFGNPLTPFKLINKKPIVPEEGEIKQNNRARSARLRIAEKK